MNINIGLLLSMAAALLGMTAMVPAFAGEPRTESPRVVADVSAFRNVRGSLGCRLFRSAEGFPETGRDVIEVRVPVTGATTRCEFRNLAPGTYAIAAMHDENDNGLLDKNFLGIPTEGYGVSNNRTYALRSPKWAESMFRVDAEDVVLSIHLRY